MAEKITPILKTMQDKLSELNAAQTKVNIIRAMNSSPHKVMPPSWQAKYEKASETRFKFIDALAKFDDSPRFIHQHINKLFKRCNHRSVAECLKAKGVGPKRNLLNHLNEQQLEFLEAAERAATKSLLLEHALLTSGTAITNLKVRVDHSISSALISGECAACSLMEQQPHLEPDTENNYTEEYFNKLQAARTKVAERHNRKMAAKNQHETLDLMYGLNVSRDLQPEITFMNPLGAPPNDIKQLDQSDDVAPANDLPLLPVSRTTIKAQPTDSIEVAPLVNHIRCSVNLPLPAQTNAVEIIKAGYQPTEAPTVDPTDSFLSIKAKPIRQLPPLETLRIRPYIKPESNASALGAMRP